MYGRNGTEIKVRVVLVQSLRIFFQSNRTYKGKKYNPSKIQPTFHDRHNFCNSGPSQSSPTLVTNIGDSPRESRKLSDRRTSPRNGHPNDPLRQRLCRAGESNAHHDERRSQNRNVSLPERVLQIAAERTDGGEH